MSGELVLVFQGVLRNNYVCCVPNIAVKDAARVTANERQKLKGKS